MQTVLGECTMERKFSIRQMAVIVVSAVILTAALTASAIYMVNSYNTKYFIGFDSKSVSLENVNKFNQVRKILKDDYYQKVDENTLVEGAVSGLADSLKDPYTVYFNKDQMKAFMEKSEGSYVGIGVSVNTDANGILNIIEPFDNSPAKAAGMNQGDKIVKVGDTDVTSIRDENMIISMIKGVENTKVKITVYRPSEDKYIQFDIVRKRIKTSNIKSEVMEGNIGYIKLVMFDSEIAGYFKKDLDNMLSKGIKGLIIDLRDNPGGSYEQVVEIADRLLPEGTIVYTEDRAGKRQTKLSNKAALGLPIVILTNGNSASASEILAGAVKDNGRGTLVGTKTFGKGLVQELKLLNDGSGIKVTISRYFTPSGVCIQGIGIKPDIEIDVPADFKNMPVSQIPRSKDIQLGSAIEALKGKMDQK
jgi:carboxyl-terminal processing protease